jgi:colanic acid/amylovoran biosynthesis protein
LTNKKNSDNKQTMFILNAHWTNRGDESAIRAMIDSFKVKLPEYDIKIMLMSEDHSFFPYEDVEIIPWFPNPDLYLKYKLKWIIQFLEIAIITLSLGKVAISKNGKKFIHTLSKSNVVVHAPGGPNIGDLFSGKLGYFEMIYLFRLTLATLKNKFVYFYAPSMGPFKNKTRNPIRKFILKRVKTLVVRDKISKDYLKSQLNLESICTIDSAFQNNISEEYLNKYPNFNPKKFENKKVIGMSISDLEWHSLHKHNKNKISSEFYKFAKYLIDNDYFILLIPQLFDKDNYDAKELKLLKTIQNLNKNKIYILPLVDAYAVQIITSKLFSVVSIRYHQNVFAAKANVPFIAISYEHKTTGLMEALEIPNLEINVNSLSSEKLIETFEFLEKNYMNIKEKLTNTTPAIKKTSQRTTSILINDLKTTSEN